MSIMKSIDLNRGTNRIFCDNQHLRTYSINVLVDNVDLRPLVFTMVRACVRVCVRACDALLYLDIMAKSIVNQCLLTMKIPDDDFYPHFCFSLPGTCIRSMTMFFIIWVAVGRKFIDIILLPIFIHTYLHQFLCVFSFFPSFISFLLYSIPLYYAQLIPRKCFDIMSCACNQWGAKTMSKSPFFSSFKLARFYSL